MSAGQTAACTALRANAGRSLRHLEQRVAVRDGGCELQLVVWVVVFHNAIVDQQLQAPYFHTDQNFHDDLQSSDGHSCPYTLAERSIHAVIKVYDSIPPCSARQRTRELGCGPHHAKMRSPAW